MGWLNTLWYFVFALPSQDNGRNTAIISFLFALGLAAFGATKTHDSSYYAVLTA
jgi:hypothetical protein